MMLLGIAKDSLKGCSSQGFSAQWGARIPPWVPLFTWDLSNNGMELLWLAKSAVESPPKLLSTVPLHWAQTLACGSGWEERITPCLYLSLLQSQSAWRDTCVPPDPTTSYVHTDVPFGHRWISASTWEELRGRGRLIAGGASRPGQWEVHLE